MSAAKEYITKKLAEEIKKSSEQIACSHEKWDVHGLSFICRGCLYYSNFDFELNGIIRDQIRTNKISDNLINN